MRSYLEQNQIPNFENLSRPQRRYEVDKLRKRELLRLQNSPNNAKKYLQTKKSFAKTQGYIHLTRTERVALINELAVAVSGWGFARIFAECIDKIHFDVNRAPRPLDEQALEQVVSRFEHYLGNMIGPIANQRLYGILIHDNNQTVAKRHTQLMKSFHQTGTLWTRVNHIIETPLFVDSELTSMVQIADLCAYAFRRYLENNEAGLFNTIFTRVDRIGATTVGARHFTNANCTCQICAGHRPPTAIPPTQIPIPLT